MVPQKRRMHALAEVEVTVLVRRMRDALAEVVAVMSEFALSSTTR
jgi:hypothetical protein